MTEDLTDHSDLELVEDEEPTLSHLVPIQRQELVTLLAGEMEDDPKSQKLFVRFAQLLQNIIHFEFNESMERIGGLYRPFNPDPGITSVRKMDEPTSSQPLLDHLATLLEKANFRQVTDDELNSAFEKASLFPLSTAVKLDEFTEMLLYRRGEASRIETFRNLSTLYRAKKVEVDYFKRLVMVIRLDPRALKRHKGTYRVKSMVPGKIYLKFFKNIPKADLEMIFPNTVLKMNLLDRVKVYSPVLGGLATAGIKLMAVVGLTLAGTGALSSTDERSMQAAGVLVLILAGYIMRSINSYKNTKMRYLQTISDGLYFKNLDNNIGVIHHLLSAAEEEEVKEALLAYFFLLRSPDPEIKGVLDKTIERWFATRFDLHFDFDVDDGVAKLKRLGLVTGDREDLKAVPLEEALRTMDLAWDRFFDYNQGSPSGSVSDDQGPASDSS